MSLQNEPEVHPVARAPAPWVLKAETYLLLVKLGSLPKGVYDPLEESWGEKENGEFRGGLGGIMIVRYRNTPVGRFILRFGHLLYTFLRYCRSPWHCLEINFCLSQYS